MLLEPLNGMFHDVRKAFNRLAFHVAQVENAATPDQMKTHMSYLRVGICDGIFQ